MSVYSVMQVVLAGNLEVAVSDAVDDEVYEAVVGEALTRTGHGSVVGAVDGAADDAVGQPVETAVVEVVRGAVSSAASSAVHGAVHDEIEK